MENIREERKSTNAFSHLFRYEKEKKEEVEEEAINEYQSLRSIENKN